MNLLAYRAWESLCQVAKFTGPGFIAVLNSHSPALTGNNVRRAGSNSPPRSDPPPELRRGPNSDSADSFPGRFENSWPGSGEARKIQFSGIGLFAALRWPCVCYFGAAVPPMDDAQKCRSYWSLCRTAEAARRRLEELSDCRTISGRDAARATIELRWVYEEVGRGARSKTESWPNASGPTKPI